MRDFNEHLPRLRINSFSLTNLLVHLRPDQDLELGLLYIQSKIVGLTSLNSMDSEVQ